jgi:hypothetical protein
LSDLLNFLLVLWIPRKAVLYGLITTVNSMVEALLGY